MTGIDTHEFACAGEEPGSGCGAFERYADNETSYLVNCSESGEHDDRVELLDDPEALRDQLHQEFIVSGFCMLSIEQANQLPENVIELRPRDISFAGCERAIRFRQSQRVRQ